MDDELRMCKTIIAQQELEIRRLRSYYRSETGRWLYGFSSNEIAERCNTQAAE